jgi:uncharacterized membrane protein YraQ (UPF0718 family)
VLAAELYEVAIEIAAELYEILPYFLVGVFIEAFIRTKGWHVHIRKTLTRYGYVAIVFATLLGVFSPLCACGILPLTISLMLGGLTLAPAMALLVSSPLMSPAGYLIALKNLGPVWANVELASGIFMGIFAGTVTYILEKRGMDIKNLFRKELPQGDFHDHDYPEEALRCGCGQMFSKKVYKRTHNPVLLFLARMGEGGWKVAKFAILGVAVAVVATRYVPDAWLESLLATTNPFTLLALALGVVPLHLNQITSSAIIFGVQDTIQVSRAAGMVLLVGGPVTALPVMAVFLSLFKPKVFFLYLGICLTGTMMVAYLYQVLGG